jgi:hypothetical protein
MGPLSWWSCQKIRAFGTRMLRDDFLDIFERNGEVDDYALGW